MSVLTKHVFLRGEGDRQQIRKISSLLDGDKRYRERQSKARGLGILEV